jgi:hypothetical protein
MPDVARRISMSEPKKPISTGEALVRLGILVILVLLPGGVLIAGGLALLIKKYREDK